MLKGIWGLLKEAASGWASDNSPRLGAALSYYTLFAISPLLIIVIFVASLWLSQDSVRTYLLDEFASLVGKRGAEALQAALTAAAPQNEGFLASIIAAGTLLVTASGLFIELQAALNKIWGVEEKSGQGLWGFIKNRLLSFAMVIGIGFLLLVSLVISAALSATAKYFTALVPGMDVFWHLVNIVLSFLVITVLFAMIYKILPDVQISWGDVWVGSAVTALLFTIGKFLLGLYLGRNTTVSAYGAAGSVVLILLWVYYSAQILFFGAEVTEAYANRYGVGLQPKPNARWINPVKAAQLSKAVPAAQPAPPEETHIQPDSEKKLQLISELRAEVESLRHLVRTGPTRT